MTEPDSTAAKSRGNTVSTCVLAFGIAGMMVGRLAAERLAPPTDRGFDTTKLALACAGGGVGGGLGGLLGTCVVSVAAWFRKPPASR